MRALDRFEREHVAARLVGRGLLELSLQLAPREMHPHAREHFAALEGLDHVVIRAGLESTHLVMRIRQGRHEDHGHLAQ